MTIAASVVVMPSRRLLVLIALLCACMGAVGCALLLGLVGELPLWVRIVCALSSVALACAGFIRVLRRRSIYHLHISGVGQIRLHKVRRAMLLDSKIASEAPNPDGMLVTLLADSTLWPVFMILRLQDEGGRIHVLPILPDSLPTASFRAISVACRWIAAHRFS